MYVHIRSFSGNRKKQFLDTHWEKLSFITVFHQQQKKKKKKRKGINAKFFG